MKMSIFKDYFDILPTEYNKQLLLFDDLEYRRAITEIMEIREKQLQEEAQKKTQE